MLYTWEDVLELKKTWRFEINGHCITHGALYRVLNSLSDSQIVELTHEKMTAISEAYVLYMFDASEPPTETISDGWENDRIIKPQVSARVYRNIKEDHDGIWRRLLVAGWPYASDYGRRF